MVLNPSVIIEEGDLNGPTLFSPNGGEIFFSGQMTIEWTQSYDTSLSSHDGWYEIYFTDDYRRTEQSRWVQIANVSTVSTSFIWDIFTFAKSEKCRISIRLVEDNGKRSRLSFSADNFSIQDRRLPVPAIIEPTSGESYFTYVPIILDPKSLEGQGSQRAFYQIYYSSKNQNIDWTLIMSNVSINSAPLFWDISNLVSDSDYRLKVELVDEKNVSQPTYVDNIQINNLTYFVIDTVPPIGYMQILNNQEFISKRDLVITLSAYDTTTAVESFRIERKDILLPISPVAGPYKDMNAMSTYYVGGEDGPKLIQVRFRDYGGNVILDSEAVEDFRTYSSVNNKEVTVFYVDINQEGEYDKWMAFGEDNPVLYLNKELISSLDGEATSMVVLDNIFYIAIKNKDNHGVLQRYFGEVITSIIEIDENDSVINTMEVFDNKIFLGLENGKLYSFNGTSLVEENEFDKSIHKLGTDNKMLYIFLNNSDDIIIMNTDINSNYTFVTTKVNA